MEGGENCPAVTFWDEKPLSVVGYIEVDRAHSPSVELETRVTSPWCRQNTLQFRVGGLIGGPLIKVWQLLICYGKFEPR